MRISDVFDLSGRLIGGPSFEQRHEDWELLTKTPVDESSEDWLDHTYRATYRTGDGIEGEVTLSIREADGYGLHNAILKDAKRRRM